MLSFVFYGRPCCACRKIFCAGLLYIFRTQQKENNFMTNSAESGLTCEGRCEAKFHGYDGQSLELAINVKTDVESGLDAIKTLTEY